MRRCRCLISFGADGNTENDCTNRSAYCDGCMETVYFGTGGGYRPATPPGTEATSPLVLMDMEGGLYGCNSHNCTNNTDVPGLNSAFVTAMVKGGSNGFAIKGAAADERGMLQHIYDGPRPTGYQPMHKSGAIILGVGGDNMFSSSRAARPPYPGEAQSIGTFYEGLLTVGYSSDTADAAVHANIVAAGYGKER